ncbi:MAG: hypothetical protein IJ323_02815 [Clostridia bacterium]|nr:hypothetical protein [Clostridia bacterium]
MKLMEDLWYSYQLDKSARLTAEEREMLSVLNQKREDIVSDMSEENIKRFDVYEEGVNLMHGRREKSSFIQGVKFGVAFITEALEKNI